MGPRGSPWVPRQLGGAGAWSPSRVTPGLLFTSVLCFTVCLAPSSPPACPLSLCSIPFGFPHFSLEWVSYPQLCSGLTQLNTNKTHSTQVEQGARAGVTNDLLALAKHSCKLPTRGPGLDLVSAVPQWGPGGQQGSIWPVPRAFLGTTGNWEGERWQGGRGGTPEMLIPVALVRAAQTSELTGP